MIPRTDERRVVSAMLCAHRTVSLCGALALAVATSSASAAIRYVRANQDLPANQQNGLSWATAFSTLQPAIDASVSGDEVRVASGTYVPTSGTDRSASFVLKQGVRLRGGYQGSGSTPDLRVVSFYTAILSGNIGDPVSSADNSFHVVRATSLSPATILDGFEIRDGNANGAGNDAIGGGILVMSGSPGIVRCLFRGNHALKGAGIGRLSGFSTSSPMAVHGSIFAENSADQGAAIYAQFAPIQLMNSTVADNDGIAAVDLSTISVASTFSSSILSRNAGGPSLELSQFRTTSAPLNVTRCCIEGWDNVAPASPTTIAADPMFLFDESMPLLYLRYVLRGDSPCLDHGECTVADVADADDDGNVSEPLPLTVREDARSIDDPLVADGGAASNPTTDMGAQETERPRTILVNHAATGANTGRSWQDAYTDLQSALAELAAPRTAGEAQIWVAQGTYKPTTGTNVDATFLLSDGTILLGGFVGDELLPSYRDWQLHPTILSGELGAPGQAGNSRHVVTAGVGDSFLDGFIVRDGNAPAIVGGGGMLVPPGAQATIAHCVITANFGTGPGSAIRVQPSPTTVFEIAHSAIVGNSATAGGMAGLFVDGINFLTIDRTLVAGNSSATGTQAGIRIQGVPAGSLSAIVNSILADNTAAGAHTMNAQISTDGSGFKLDHCAIESFAPALPGATLIGCFAIDAEAGMVNARGNDGSYGTFDDNYLPTPCGGLVDAGSAITAVGEPAGIDLNGDGLSTSVLNDFYDQAAIVDLPLPNAGLGRDVGPVERQILLAANPDLNGSGAVDAADLATLLGAWGTVGSEFDLNGDCVVDASDLAVLLGAWD